LSGSRSRAAGGSADDTVCFQLGDLGVTQPDFGQ
jgi:hypothetical protein